MTKNKKDKIIKISGIIILSYLILYIILYALRMILRGFDSSQSINVGLMNHVYFAQGLTIILLLFLSFIVYRGIKRRKWINLLIVLPLIFIVPRLTRYLPVLTHSYAIQAKQDSEEALYSDIIKMQYHKTEASIIKTKKVFKFKCKNQQPEKNGNLVKHFEFDMNGNIIKEDNSQFFYDSLNRRIKVNELNNITGSNDTTQYFYNSDNLLVKEKYSHPGYVRITKYIYDSNLNIIEQSSYKNGKINYEIKYEFDTDKRLIKSISKDYEYNSSLKHEYKYIDNKKIEYSYTNEGEIYNEIHFAYDSLGHEIEQIVINHNPKSKSEHFTIYDQNGNKIKDESSHEGKIYKLETWDYDVQNNLVSHTDNSGTTRYFYENNLLSKEEFYDKENEELKWIKLYTYQ